MLSKQTNMFQTQMETTVTNRAIYDKMTSEFSADVIYRLANAYELVKEEDDFRAKLYCNAVDGQFAYMCGICGIKHIT